jgi:hypothetical protein
MGEPLLRLLDLEDIRPSDLNCRLFVDTDELGPLIRLYERYAEGDPAVVLPDPPIVRPKGAAGWEILAGERRITAAVIAGVERLPCRVEKLGDQEAFLFQMAHNQSKPLTTVELAYRAAEMERMGFTPAEMVAALPGVNLGRYIAVGRLIDRDWFTDEPKLCDPSILEWFEAAQHGKKHFKWCFHQWVTGAWDAEMCSKRFRKRGQVLPIDNAERGFRVSRNANKLIVRGQLDLDVHDLNMAIQMLTTLELSLKSAKNYLLETGMFGPREIELINPLTLGQEDDNYDD